MTVKKKGYKKLTNAEKKSNKEATARLRDKGILPPIKPRLNRTKFAKEVVAEFMENLISLGDLGYIHSAIRWMTPSVDESSKIKVTAEEIGVLKMLKIAIEIKKFEAKIKANGDTVYEYMDLYEKAVAPIRNL